MRFEDTTQEGMLLKYALAVLTVLLLTAPGALAETQAIAAFTPGARILFQGDSITDGNRGRSADPNHILGHGYCFIIAAKFGEAFPEANLEFFNRGISGNTVLDLEKRWQKDTLDLKPDVLSILIGVNDFTHAGSGATPGAADTYEHDYDALLTATLAALPNVRLVLGEPFLLPSGSSGVGEQ